MIVPWEYTSDVCNKMSFFNSSFYFIRNHAKCLLVYPKKCKKIIFAWMLHGLHKSQRYTYSNVQLFSLKLLYITAFQKEIFSVAAGSISLIFGVLLRMPVSSHLLKLQCAHDNIVYSDLTKLYLERMLPLHVLPCIKFLNESLDLWLDKVFPMNMQFTLYPLMTQNKFEYILCGFSGFWDSIVS